MPVVARVVVNGLLLGGAAVSLFPLAWMLSASLMAPGEASGFPPPFLGPSMSLALVWLLAATLCSSAANLLLKLASTNEGLSSYISRPFFGGVFVLGLGLLAYMRALQAIPVSVAYPTMVGATMLATSIVGAWLFDERIGWMQYAGAALIFCGILLLTQRVQS